VKDKINTGTILTSLIGALLVLALGFYIQMPDKYVPRKEYNKDYLHFTNSITEIKLDNEKGFQAIQRSIEKLSDK